VLDSDAFDRLRPWSHPESLGDGDGVGVVRSDVGDHDVEAERIERVVEESPRRLGGVPVAPVISRQVPPDLDLPRWTRYRLEDDITNGVVESAIEHDPPPGAGRASSFEHLLDEGSGFSRVAVVSPPDDLRVAPDRVKSGDVVTAERLEVKPGCMEDGLDHIPSVRHAIQDLT
jgi:hypothetical protein